MTDMGPYFEPPRKAAVKRWQVMKIVADSGLRFKSKNAKAFMDGRILAARNPRIVDVIERIEDERRRLTGSE
jgi:hypothetical protein